MKYLDKCNRYNGHKKMFILSMYSDNETKRQGYISCETGDQTLSIFSPD